MTAVRRLMGSGAFAAAVCVLSAASGAQAASPNTGPEISRGTSLRMTVEKPRFTCAGRGVTMSHVVFQAGRAAAGAATLPCCDGQFGCAQFLSTATVLHGPHPWHS